MVKGYAGKFLDIDLSKEDIKEVNFDEEILRQYLGGRGLGAKILWDRLGKNWEKIDPLGPRNLLLFLTGPLSGYCPGARICVTGKSPQSNGIVGSTVAGGEFAVDLRCAGYDGIIFSGRAKSPVYLFIKDGQVEIRNAKHLWGRRGKETVKILTKELHQELENKYPNYGKMKEPSILYIGPAGERKVRVSAVMAKWTHAAGYGGYGAVMGSKKLKAIAVKGTGSLPEVADIKKITKFIDKMSAEAYSNDAFRRWGTGSGGYEFAAGTSSEPIRNWQEEWHDEKSYGVDEFERRVWIKRYWGDYGCPVTCLKVAFVKTGPFKGAIGDNPDYELQAYLGTNFGIFKPEDNVYLSEMIDDLGLCAIQTGNVLGFAAELYQRGILTKEDIDGIELKWGDTKAFGILAENIAKRRGIGDILAEGVYRTALKIKEMKGVDVMDYAIQVKGISVGAHGTRSKKDFTSPISYVCNVQGGDHTSLASIPAAGGWSEMDTILMDSAVSCSFLSFTAPKSFRSIFDFLNAVTGWNITKREWYNNMSRRILHIQRVALLLGGPDAKWDPKVHDDNPKRFYEPLPSGPDAGEKTEKAEVEKLKREYYKAVGWDEKGIPKPKELKRLGLADLAKALDRVGK